MIFICLDNTPFSTDRAFFSEEEILELKKMVFFREYGSLTTDPNAGIVCNTVDKIIRKEIIEKNYIRFNPDIRISEDALFNLEMLYGIRNAYYINSYVYHYRQRITSAGHSSYNCDFNENLIPFYNASKDIFDKYKAPDILYKSLEHRCYCIILDTVRKKYIKGSMNKSLFERNKQLNNELSQEPFHNIIHAIELKNFDKKNQIIAILFKCKLFIIYLILWEIKKRIIK